MNVWDIILICLAAAVVLWFAVFSVISRVKAKRAGIIRVKFPANSKTFVCNLVCSALWIIITVSDAGQCAEYKETMDAVRTLGFQKYHKEYLNWDVTPIPPETEQSATEELFNEYREKYDRERNRQELRTLCTITFGIAALFNGAYITKKGIVMFGDLKPRDTAAKVEDGMLCFNSRGKREYTVLRLPASEENLRLYSEFISDQTAARNVPVQDVTQKTLEGESYDINN